MGCPGCGDAAKVLAARVDRLEKTVATLVSGPLELGPDPLAEEVTPAGTPRTKGRDLLPGSMRRGR